MTGFDSQGMTGLESQGLTLSQTLTTKQQSFSETINRATIIKETNKRINRVRIVGFFCANQNRKPRS